ncbi:MAG: ABC transporter permease [Candidatus Saccharimonas sp.]
MIDTIARASRSIRQAKARTLLTSLAIGVGAFTITLALAAGAGGRNYAADVISSNTNPQQIQVTQKQSPQSSGPQEYSTDPTVSFGGGFTFKQLGQTDIAKMEKVSGVASVTPAYDISVEYVTRPGQKKYQAGIQALDSGIKLTYAAGGGAVQDNQIVIPEAFSKVLGFSSPQQAIGQTIDLVVVQAASKAVPQATKTFNFTVVGVTEKNVLAFGTNSSLSVTENAGKGLYTYNQEGSLTFGNYMAALVVAKDGVDPTTVKDSLQKLGYEAQTAEDLMSTIFQFINVLQAILIGFGVLAVLTSVFGIINTQYISVLERTQQIGLMKALGMRRRDVGRLFKFEAAWIGFLGGAIGAGIAILTGIAANPLITDALSLGKGTELLIFQPISVAAIIIGLMLVSVGAGILPARKAAKLDPIEALRTE